MLRAPDGSSRELADMHEFYHGVMTSKKNTAGEMRVGLELATDHGPLVKRHVLGDVPLTALVLGGHGEIILISSGLAGLVAAAATIFQHDQRGIVFPIHQLPLKQRMLRFRLADEMRVLLVV